MITQTVRDWSEVLANLFFGQSGSHNKDNEEISRGAVCHNTIGSHHNYML